MALVSLADLRTQSRNSADMRNGGIWSDQDFNAGINRAYGELHDLLVQAYPERYFLTSSLVSLQPGVTQYALPSDYYKLAGVDWQASSQAPWLTLTPYEFKERNALLNAPLSAICYQTNAQYCHMGSTLSILPPPQTGNQIQIWYVPQYQPFVNDTDAREFQNGWEEFVVADVCVQCLAAEESDTSVFERLKAEAKERILQMAPLRDVGAPHRVVDVRRTWGTRY